ncbi:MULTISPECIES: RelA/SpoT family protein [Pseudothermotoga]|jgi:GTP pyrophosphokinase|uniref:(P)ppGpp synthetase I, SpoT/RelA n=1 Tax=Pseudothermotoga lettingae (strain ATCC BAA-301 / DSM 14385 / NBRC 107922 / TMO) TaxID=416591 RepID=A8F521_PSELT|nr:MULTISPECIES: bifunctional (p)ppGpp synthetase/guanosine-3',5'-bis(diphosphate) 3'-pyrophosphohydrolase [Pseudothermotoga]ABV33255.1 (p)ppGpp synthetase I, SpoT/RelA [Pseudothermotoga lettingae TMO]MDI3493901.1 diphosphokinase / guanosine-3,5-bis(diphosphate) 3-diphosphatase [Pseudothermotoga sp.]GLI49828.1 (p)ppGpp synthetase [Pseudothermotoga lettingae TMO]
MVYSLDIAKQILDLQGKFYSEDDKKLLTKAYDMASYAHENFYRESGEPFIAHPVEVCKILAQMNVDIQTLVAAMLHDAVEDSEGKVKIEDVEREFGKEISRIVDGVTKVSRLNTPVNMSDSKLKIETIQKMLFAMAEDIRVIFVKLGDRLHNMRTIDFVRDEQKRLYKARETLEIYAPIAHKMGIYSIKWELEDLAFKVLNRNEYNRIKNLVSEKKREREQRVKEYVEILQKALADNNIVARVEGRFKHYYGIWQKLKGKGKSFDEIYDLFGIRAIVKDVTTCYNVLGIVHSIWKPLPGRIKDYIAAPKSNGYRSLHTTVITGYGEPLEVQIRDEEMHTEAEYGLIAHWIYKDGINVRTMQKWVNQLLEWRRELTKDLSGLEEFKKELQMDEVFVFTPKGEVKHLPLGATPIDFAYTIHTDIGHRFAGAKVNGKMVPISYQLKNGDLVEIIVGKNSRPSLDWLKYAKSPRTKAKIRKYFREQFQSELVDRGKDVLRRVSKQLAKPIEEIMESIVTKKYLQNQGITEDEFYSRIGEGTISYGDLLNLLNPLTEKNQPLVKKKRKLLNLQPAVEISGLKNIDIHLAKCCGPVPGDEIIGVVSRKGITVHNVSCPNIKNIDSDKIFEARWNGNSQDRFETALRLELREKKDIGKLVQLLENKGITVLKASLVTTKWNYSVASLSLAVNNLKQLEEAKHSLESLDSVISVERGKLV